MEARFRKASDVVATLFGRPPGGDEAALLEVPEAAIPRDWPEKLRFRKRPKPYSRAISWTPIGMDEQPSETSPYELFVAQGVLREVRQHLITATTGEPYGFLLGQVVYCPWRETPYIVIDSVRRETQDLPPADELDRFRHAWVAATRDARHRRGEVIGWYHRHGVLGMRLSEWDLRLQEEFFPEPWHCALVIASGRGGIIGGFIQRSRRARLFRKGLAPFQELVDLDAKLVNGLKPSCVDWQNYRAGESVSVIRANWPTPAARSRAWQGEAHGGAPASPAPGGSGERTRKARKGPLGGRSWGGTPRPAAPTPPAARKAEPEAPAASGAGAAADTPAEKPREPLKKDEFQAIVGSADDVVTFESEEHMGEPYAAPLPERPAGRRRRPSGPRRPGQTGADDPEFLEAVWGEAPFEPEAEEPQVEKDEVEARAEAAAPPDAPPERPRFELVAPFEPEPVETDEPRSLEWLLSILGDTLSSRLKAREQEDAAEPVATADAGPAVEEATGARPAREDREAEAARTGTAEERAAAEERARETRRASPSVVVPRRDRRAFVIQSSDPDDHEAPIPVVVFEEDRRWRPSRTQRRAAAAVAIAAGAWLAYASLRPATSPEPPPTAPPPVAQPAAPPAEFVALADTYLTRVQEYRQGLVDFRRGQRDCTALTADFGSVLAARSQLADFVASRPELTERFETMGAEFATMSQRFGETGCPAPPAPGPSPDGASGS